MSSPDTIDDAPLPRPDGTLAPTIAQAAPPSVPGFEIVDELGRGGMGVVYRARQTALNRDVALKLILAGGHASTNNLSRFRREAESVARLQHPNVVQIYEVGVADGRPFFALEYVTGGTLAAKLNGVPLPPRAAAAIVETLARAIDHAHAKGVVHRDLKPSNVLLASSERDPLGRESGELPLPLAHLVPKVADFGLAKQLDESDARTGSNAILGTPSYMAPEQAAGHSASVGPLADVYALGAILYECLTGRPPFRAATPVETVLQVLSDEPVPPLRLQKATPRDLNTIALKCLEKSPARRYPSAVALADDLRAYLGGEPIRARPTGAIERGWKWAKRRPTAAALLVVSVAALAGLLGGGLWYNARLKQLIADVTRRQYAANLILAQKAVDDDDWLRARGLLDACVPQGGQADLRGFEWYYLDGLGRTELRAIEAMDFAWMPDSKALAVLARESDHYKVSISDSVSVVDVATGQARTVGKLPNFRAVHHIPGSLSVSPDGRLVAAATAKRDDASVDPFIRYFSLTIWNVDTGAEVRSVSLKTSFLGDNVSRRVTFSPDGRKVAANVLGGLCVWDVASGEQLFHGQLGDHSVVFCTFDRTGEWLAAASEIAGCVWHIASGRSDGWQPVATFRPVGLDLAVTDHPVPSGLPIRTADGRFVAAAETDFASSLPLKLRQGFAVAWRRGGNSLAVAHDSSVIAGIAGPGGANDRMAYRGNRYRVTKVAYSPDGQFIAALCVGEVKVWRTSPAAYGVARFTLGAAKQKADPALPPAFGLFQDILRPGSHKAYYPKSVAFSPDGRFVAASRPDGSLIVIDARTGETTNRFRIDQRTLHTFAFTPDGTRLAALASAGGSAREGSSELAVWECGRDLPPKLVQLNVYSADALAVRHDGAEVAVLSVPKGDTNRRVDIFALTELRLIRTTTVPGHFFRAALAYCRDDTLVVALAGKTLEIWRLPMKGSPSISLDGFSGGHVLKFDPSGETVISSGVNGISALDVRTGRLQFAIRAGASDAAIGRDGRIFTIVADKVRVWDAESGLELLTMRTVELSEPAVFHIANPDALALSSDGTRLAIVGSTGGLRIWDLTKPTPAEIDRREAIVGKD